MEKDKKQILGKLKLNKLSENELETNQECIQAVSYIFDENKDAVQHRIMYMYNPDMVQSAFHESQNYILTYQTVRFFDRWGY